MQKMATHCRKVFIVGISGTTNSGKSTVAMKLATIFPNAIVICQDMYSLRPGDPRLLPVYIPELNHHNWEDYQTLEMDKMVNDLKTIVSSSEKSVGDKNVLIIVEGFSIFGWRPLVSLFHLKYFLSVDKDVCFERRKTRQYTPPDVPGYFDAYVWPKYLEYLATIKDQKDVVFLDGSRSVDGIAIKIQADINSLMGTCSS